MNARASTLALKEIKPKRLLCVNFFGKPEITATQFRPGGQDGESRGVGPVSVGIWMQQVSASALGLTLFPRARLTCQCANPVLSWVTLI